MIQIQITTSKYHMLLHMTLNSVIIVTYFGPNSSAISVDKNTFGQTGIQLSFGKTVGH